MSIQDIPKKIKGEIELSPNILPISAIILLVGIGSFLLGRISEGMSSPKEKVQIIETSTYTQNTAQPIVKNTTQKGAYVASKNGKLYYPVGCKSASRLSEKNKVYFGEKVEAENAGYEFASSCD